MPLFKVTRKPVEVAYIRAASGEIADRVMENPDGLKWQYEGEPVQYMEEIKDDGLPAFEADEDDAAS